MSRALRDDPWAGMMLTFPLANSTICTCPAVLPGKASVFAVKQHRPRGLSAVSKTAQRSGELLKLYTRILFCRATTMWVRDNLIPRTDVRTGSCMATFCFASSQMIICNPAHQFFCPRICQGPPTLFCANLGCFPPPMSAMKFAFPSISTAPMPALKSCVKGQLAQWNEGMSRKLISRHAKLAWIGIKYWARRSVSIGSQLGKKHIGILQNPVSSPTAKQLASWLKEADKATGLLELSITGLVFILAGRAVSRA